MPEDDAKQDDNRKSVARQAEALGPDTIEVRMRTRIRETIEAIVEEELEAALGAERSARVGAVRQGYRHGTRDRTLTTSLGPTTFALPRARLVTASGATTEWHSAIPTLGTVESISCHRLLKYLWHSWIEGMS